jgi:cytochrome c553
MTLSRRTQTSLVATALLVALAGTGAVWAQDAKPPFWAYTYNPPGCTPTPDDGQPGHVPDSSVSYTVPQTRDRFLAPDWHPGDHPSMPPVVAEGRKPDVYACGFCHRASGTGGPENADIAGLPIPYFAQQMQDYQSSDLLALSAYLGSLER